MRKMAVIIGVLLLCAGVAFAQGDPSAKFAAAWDDSELIVDSEAFSCDPAIVDPEDPSADPAAVFDYAWDHATLLATMKMPQRKEILTGISTESKIILNTIVKGKLGGSGTAAGYGKVAVRVFAINEAERKIYRPVPNGKIVLNARYQQLDATLGGVIQSCTDGLGGEGEGPGGIDANPPNGTIDVATECFVTPEQIGLLTANQSANHFNVVFVDLPQGTYKIVAFFTVLSASFADATENACAYAYSKVVLGDRIVTLQDVRAVKGGIEPIDME